MFTEIYTVIFAVYVYTEHFVEMCIHLCILDLVKKWNSFSYFLIFFFISE